MRIYVAELDRFLVPKFHTDWSASKLPGADIRRVPNAWHFAFMDKPKWPLPTADGDVGADPEGFDRAAFLQQLAEQLPAFFDQVNTGRRKPAARHLTSCACLRRLVPKSSARRRCWRGFGRGRSSASNSLKRRVSSIRKR